MRILEIETFGRGGLAHYVCNLSRALADRGHDVTLITTETYELDAAGSGPVGVTIVRRIGRISDRSRRTLSGIALRLALGFEAVVDAVRVGFAARALRPDVIHLHCTNVVAAVYVVALRISGRPVVYTAHVVTPHEPVPFQKVIYRCLFHFTDFVIAHSTVDRGRLLDEFGLGADRVSVVPHGEYGFFEAPGAPLDRISIRRRLGVDAAAEVALFFGYIREYKGLDLLLEAWPAVSGARPGARLLIAGDPVQIPPARRREFEAWATRVGAICRLEYIPFDEVAPYFRAADVIVMPYRRISQSGVLFLALALGVPLVATKVGAVPEVLEDGDSALLVPPDSPKALSDALIRMLGDPVLQARLAAGGRLVAERHSWPSIAEETESLFAGLVAKSSSAVPPQSRNTT